MALSIFLKNMAITIAISLLICMAINVLIPQISSYPIIWFALILFIAISIGIYILGQRAITTDDKNFFLYIIMVNIIVKLVASILTIGLFKYLFDPSHKFYILHFVIIYLLFTIFETHFLSIQAKAK